ncbi:MAG: acyl carrier protein [Steroidobacteraceae bacterium]
MTDATPIIERLSTLFADTFHIAVPTAQTDLLDSGILDSFQMVELIFQLEQHFGLRVDIDRIDLDHLRTLERIAGLVAAGNGAARRMAGAASGNGLA